MCGKPSAFSFSLPGVKSPGLAAVQKSAQDVCSVDLDLCVFHQFVVEPYSLWTWW